MAFRHLVAGAAALAMSSAAAANDFWLLTIAGTTPNRQIFLIDKASVRPTAANHVRAWTWTYYEDQGEKVAMSKSLVEFDCAGHAFREVKYVQLKANEDVVLSKETPVDGSPFEQEMEGTVVAREAAFSCNGNLDGALHMGNVQHLPISGFSLLERMDERSAPTSADRPLR